MNIKTIEDIRKLGPCYDPARYLPKDWTGTALDILRVTECPAVDRLWVVLNTGWIDDNIMHEFAYRCAEMVLPFFSTEYPDDDRPRKAIEAKRAWVCGEMADDELAAARDAAWAAYVNVLIEMLGG